MDELGIDGDRGWRLMPDLLARGMAAMVAGLLAVAVAALVITSQPPAGSQVVNAEFDDAYPLIEGMHVRVDGAIAGSVGDIEVNDRGNAVVSLTLNDSIEPARADATAAVRQQDTTGDSYVAFEPGDSDERLGEEGIVCAAHDRCEQTLVAPRLDDLLNAFGPGERTGVKLILVETAKALDRRGADLNAAALTLRPALVEANKALAEVSSQNRALKDLLASASAVTGQAAGRGRELAALIDGLAVTLHETSEEREALDAGLDRLPETAAEARRTLAALGRTTRAAIPIARDLEAGAPQFASAIERLAPFLGQASAWLDDTEPTIALTRKLVRAAQPSLEVSKERVVTGAFDLTGATADLLNTVLGGEDAFPALFGDDSYGVGEGTLGKRGFGAVAVEPGDLPGYPAAHADRNWLRVSAVINCEVFGRPVEPGCLAEVVADGAPTKAAAKKRSVRGKRGPLSGAGSAEGSQKRAGPKRSEVPGLPTIPELLEGAGGAAEGLLPGKGNRGRSGGAGDARGALEDVVDFLFGS